MITCCDGSGRLTPDSRTNPQCAPILVPHDDPIHAPQGTQCMNFVRTTTTRDRRCTPPGAPAEPVRFLLYFSPPMAKTKWEAF